MYGQAMESASSPPSTASAPPPAAARNALSTALPTADNSAPSQPAKAEMLDIEAHLTFEVDAVSTAAASLRAAARQVDALIVEDVVSEQPGGALARMTIRVPVRRTESFLDSLGALGRLRSRQASARDIGKEYFDAELRLHNLEATMRRYEEILKQAKDVNEILRVEGELSRLRAEIEQTKGNMRWLNDRAARATVYIVLMPRPREAVAITPPEPEPTAKFYPGLRLAFLTDLRGENGHVTYGGAGISAKFSRQFAIQLDGLREGGTGGLTRGLDVVLLSIGGETYSDFLGSGKRKFLNPYLGWMIGYARFTGSNQAAAGLTVGVELWKTKTVVLDAQVRAIGMFFGEVGAHVGVEPALGANVAF
jgi:hypothetical protein